MSRPVLPQNDTDPNGRASGLAAARQTWRYAYDWPAGVATSAELPKSDNYGLRFGLESLPIYLKIGANLAGMALEGWERGDLVAFLRRRFEGIDHEGLAKHLLSTPQTLAEGAPVGRPASWQGYQALFATWEAPPAVAAMDEAASRDRSFAWQRVGGANPMVLARCRRLPPNFPLDEARFASVVPGDSLAAAGAEGRLFLADYAGLDGVVAGVTDGLQKYVAAPLALFVVPKGQTVLAPVAIQVGQKPGPASPIVTPADGWRWRMAQTLVQIADANVHEGIVHLGRTHLVMEAVGLAMHRQLSEQHPLFVLLAPHLETTFAINHSAKTDLIAPNGTVDRCFAPQIDAFCGVVKSALDSYPLDTTDPVSDLRDRGLDDASLLQHPYRDGALQLWNELRVFLAEYVALYYTTDADVVQDTELQAFVAELSAQDGGRLKGVPPARTIDQLVFLLARLVFVAGPQHSAVNFPQFPFMSYPPNMPGASYLPPMDAATPDDEARYTAMLPPWKIAIESATMVYLLSNVRVSTLGDYGLVHFRDLRVHAVVKRFQERLEAAEAEQVTADLVRPYSYPFLRPSQVLQSISI